MFKKIIFLIVGVLILAGGFIFILRQGELAKFQSVPIGGSEETQKTLNSQQASVPNPSTQTKIFNGRIFCAGSDEKNKKVIFNYASDGSDKKIIDFPATYIGWFRDGSKAWATTADGKLWNMNPDGTEQKLIADFSGGVVGTPAPSPDGKQVAITGFGINTDHPEIWVIDSDGSNPHPLTKTTTVSTTRSGQKILWSVHPSWTPDGQKIVYASTQSGSTQIWTMNADGSSATQITAGNAPDSPDSNVPEYSLDGKNIVFWSGYETEYGDVWTMSADGANRTRITNEPENINADNPTWSPDGQWVIFISNKRGGKGPINAWVVERSGGTPKLLSDSSDYCAWQPVYK